MIRKRMLALVVVALIVTAVAPVAMADHCYRCRWVPGYNILTCANVTTNSFTGGQPICWMEGEGDDIFCYTAGPQCERHIAGLVPIELEYTVASVERIDEPQPQNETLRADATGATQ